MMNYKGKASHARAASMASLFPNSQSRSWSNSTRGCFITKYKEVVLISAIDRRQVKILRDKICFSGCIWRLALIFLTLQLFSTFNSLQSFQSPLIW